MVQLIMAKRRSSRKHINYSIGRDVMTIANRRLPRSFSAFTPYQQNIIKLDIARSHLVDDRLFRPRRQLYRAPRTIVGTPARVKPKIKKGFISHGYKFQNSRMVATCVRRRSRREVLFAAGAAGKGRRNFTRKVRRNASSSISC